MLSLSLLIQIVPEAQHALHLFETPFEASRCIHNSIFKLKNLVLNRLLALRQLMHQV